MLVAALNGLAAVSVIEGDPGVGRERYLEALRCTEENSEEFRADPLQTLHTLYHLEGLGGLGGEVRRQTLGEQGEEIRSRYMAPFHAKLAATQKEYNAVHAQVRDGGCWRSALTSSLMSASLPKAELTDEGRIVSVRCQVAAADSVRLGEEKGSLWWREALHLAGRSEGGGEALVRKIRDSLLETDHLAERRGGGHQNASSLAHR